MTCIIMRGDPNGWCIDQYDLPIQPSCLSCDGLVSRKEAEGVIVLKNEFRIELLMVLQKRLDNLTKSN